jgi:hypothetical protein
MHELPSFLDAVCSKGVIQGEPAARNLRFAIILLQKISN